MSGYGQLPNWKLFGLQIPAICLWCFKGKERTWGLQSFLSTLMKEIVLQGPQNMNQNLFMCHTILKVSEPFISTLLGASDEMSLPYHAHMAPEFVYGSSNSETSSETDQHLWNQILHFQKYLRVLIWAVELVIHLWPANQSGLWDHIVAAKTCLYQSNTEVFICARHGSLLVKEKKSKCADLHFHKEGGVLPSVAVWCHRSVNEYRGLGKVFFRKQGLFL